MNCLVKRTYFDARLAKLRHIDDYYEHSCKKRFLFYTTFWHQDIPMPRHTQHQDSCVKLIASSYPASCLLSGWATATGRLQMLGPKVGNSIKGILYLILDHLVLN